MNWHDEIRAAAGRIKPYVRRTPASELTLPGFDRPIAVKLENMQITGSFKPRGAFNTLLSQPVPAAGVVAASGGNHGAAVARAARTLGHRARIFVPEIAGPSKIALIREQGAELTVVPGVFDNAMAAARALEAETGALQLHPFDAAPTIAGQGALFLEWEEQGLDADTVLVAVGGGGLISGAAAWFAGRRKIVAVEPASCPTLFRAFENGGPVQVDVGGIAVNSLGSRILGDLNFALLKDRVTPVLVEDAAIRHAQVSLWQSLRQVAEPGGAAALAALLSGAYKPGRGESVAVLVCGGNPAPGPFDA
jgi:threonine dehydratase